MKAIKIEAKNFSAIEAALLAVNGRASAHSFTTGAEVAVVVAQAAEAELEALSIPKTRRVGATYRKTSGEAVNNTYARKAYTRPATGIVIERRSSGWYLTSVVKREVGQAGGGRGHLYLTQAQAEEAIAAVKAKFQVQA